MTEKGNEPVFRIRWDASSKLKVAGVMQWRADSQFLTSTDGWSAEVVVPEEYGLRPSDFYMQPCSLLLDSATLLLGRCERVECGQSPSVLRLSGRDYLAELVQCDLDPAAIIKEGDTLKTAILSACGPIGITSVISDGGYETRTLRCGKPIGRKRTAVAPGEVKMQDLKPRPGRSLWDWLSHLLSRHGLTAQPAGVRSALLLQDPDYEQPSMGTIRRSVKYGKQSNIVQSTAIRDGSRFVTCMLMTGQGGAEGESRTSNQKTYDVTAVAGVWNDQLTGLKDFSVGARRKPPSAAALDDGSVYRFLYHQDKEARNQEQLLKSATRVVADRLKESLQYQVTIKGFRDPVSGVLYAPDTMVDVEDDVCDIHEPLWVAGRTFEDGHGGPITRLTCWRPGSFSIG